MTHPEFVPFVGLYLWLMLGLVAYGVALLLDREFESRYPQYRHLRPASYVTTGCLYMLAGPIVFLFQLPPIRTFNDQNYLQDLRDLQGER